MKRLTWLLAIAALTACPGERDRDDYGSPGTTPQMRSDTTFRDTTRADTMMTRDTARTPARMP